jgi:prepilin peptidase CpaA
MEGWLDLESIVLGAFVLALVTAAVSDVVGYVIPNTVVVAVIGLFVAAAALSSSQVSWLSHLAAAAIVLALGISLFSYRLMGGGDVKFWASCALWAGIDLLMIQLVYVTVIGVVVALLLALIRMGVALGVRVVPGRACIVLPRVLRRGAPVPYGVAIAAGTLLLFAQMRLMIVS